MQLFSKRLLSATRPLRRTLGASRCKRRRFGLRPVASLGVVALAAAACGKSPETSGGADGSADGAGEESRWPFRVALPLDADPRFERVVLVTIDTLRADHVSSYGYVRPTTPFLDSMAARGVLFERAMASCSQTAPSHATLLTGLHPTAHGVIKNGLELDPEALDLARLFGAAGFETGAFLNVKFLSGIAGAFERVDVQLVKGAPVVDAAIAWLREADRAERFFLWVHLYDPHHWKLADRTPKKVLRELAEADRERTDAQRWSGAPGFIEYLSRLHGLTLPEPEAPFDLGWRVHVKGQGDLPVETPEDYRAFIEAYDAQTRYADRQLARLYAAVEGLSGAGGTLWVVTSDHGEGLASHGVAGHGSRLYQEQLHVPLVVHASDGSLAPKRVQTLVQHVDVYPTLAAVLGTEIEGLDAELYGASLWPLMDEAAADSAWLDRPAFSQRRPPEVGTDAAGNVTYADEDAELYALQSERFKYLLHVPGEDEFFDLQLDPLELENRIGEASKERDALRRLLEARLESYRAQAEGDVTGDVREEWLEELRDLGYVE